MYGDLRMHYRLFHASKNVSNFNHTGYYPCMLLWLFGINSPGSADAHISGDQVEDGVLTTATILQIKTTPPIWWKKNIWFAVTIERPPLDAHRTRDVFCKSKPLLIPYHPVGGYSNTISCNVGPTFRIAKLVTTISIWGKTGYGGKLNKEMIYVYIYIYICFTITDLCFMIRITTVCMGEN